MSIHKPWDRHFAVLGGAVMTEGGSLNLSKGQFGIFNVGKTTINGVTAVSSFKGLPKKSSKFELRLGKSDLPVTRSQNNKSFSSFPFCIEDVKDLKVSLPQTTEQEFDEVIIGYNGIDCETSIDFQVGDEYKIVVELSGPPIGLLGYTDATVTIPIYLDAEACSPYGKDCVECDPCAKVPCKHIIIEAIKRLKRHELRGGVTVDQFIEVTPVLACVPEEEQDLIPYKFWCLTVCDTGDATALAAVQTQYPKYKVRCKDRVGALTTYEFVAPASDEAPADYEQSLPSILKGCDDCPPGYEEIAGGYVYAVCLEDDGIDEASTVEGLGTAVAGTGLKADAQNKGAGFYTVVLEEKLSDKDFTAFIEANPTATIDFVGSKNEVCDPEEITVFPWEECGECNAIEECYVMTLPDGKCGKDRLAELQAAMPHLTIELEGTSAGCQTKYKTTVISNLVCDQCDPIYEDFFETEAPSGYMNRKWKPYVEPAVAEETEGETSEEDCGCPTPEPDGSCCKCGIRLKGKPFTICPDECLIEDLAFEESSTRIRVSGGFLTEVRAGEEKQDTPFNVEYLSEAKDRTHLGGNLRQFEDRGRVFFTGEAKHKSLVAQMFKGDSSHIEPCKQYADYAITIERNNFSQSFAGKLCETVTYHVLVELGRHKGVEEVLNSLATAAGCSPVCS